MLGQYDFVTIVEAPERHGAEETLHRSTAVGLGGAQLALLAHSKWEEASVADLRSLAKVGIWTSVRQWSERASPADGASELEQLGFEMVWIGGSVGQIEIIDAVLASTERLVAATGITQIWMNPPTEVAADYHRLNDTHSGRFVLGLGVGHAPFTEAAGHHYERPLAKLRSYLDELDQADRPVPQSGRVIAALRPKALAIAAERAAGVHPYNVPPQHTAQAREAPGTLSSAGARAEDPLRYGPIDRTPGRPRGDGHLPEPAQLPQQPEGARLRRTAISQTAAATN